MFITVAENKEQQEAIEYVDECARAYVSRLTEAQEIAQGALHMMIRVGIDPVQAVDILKGKFQVESPIKDIETSGADVEIETFLSDPDEYDE